MPLHKTLSAAVAALCLLLAGKTVHANDPTLTIYTYDSFVSDWGPGPVVKKAFEAECGCTLNWVGIADGVALLNRLKLEGKSSKADIVLGLDTNLIAEAAATGLFTSHETDLSNVDVPGGWADKTFIPYDYGYFAFVYDTDAIKTPPTSLRELVDGDPDVKIAIQDPRTATPGLGLLLWVKAVYGDDAPKAWKKLKDRVLTVTPGWSEAYGLFTNGEVPMVLSYTTSPAYHMVAEESDRYQAAGFEEGHYMQIEVAGMLEGSGQKELARKFLSFMTSPGFQNAIPTTNWMFPAAAVSEPVPAAFDTLVKPTKTLLFSPQHVLENRKAWVDEWLSVMSR